ncbi:MAG: HlyD family efflux transporter periplasmic adaptor subunit [Chthonomonadaceae bacterium]|nr:HlyD family efflux transporter periplasmic adaptor subunit [Chthonomonadaceae bacterium]
MNKWAVGIGGVVLVGAALWVVSNGAQAVSDIEYRYAPVSKSDLMLSTSSTGVLVPLTKVDVKSKAGGKVVKLFVEEGTPVVAGQTIALIDPEDTRAIYQQAEADVSSANARVSQARINATIEQGNSVDRVKGAEIALYLARTRLAKVEQTSRVQPVLVSADIKSAQASLDTAREALRSLEQTTVPQTRRDAKGQYDRSKSDWETNLAELERQQNLLAEGYVSKSAVEKQKSALVTAETAYRLAEQRLKTIETQIDSDLKTARARVRQAEQSLIQAQANENRIPISRHELEEARNNVRTAEVNLSEARTARLNVNLRRSDIATAAAGSVRSQVAMKNAKIQLDSTTVVAPRDGIVTMKYLEEGTIIPPGTSTFAQGTSLVQIADTTTMFIECSVDEADIGSVNLGQQVRIVVEAYPGTTYKGSVKKIFPAAETANSLTIVKVRVQIEGKETSESNPGAKSSRQGIVAGAKGERNGTGQKRSETVLRPGMNATCEFIQFSKKDVLVAPQQAIKREGGKTTVRVKSADPKKPTVREVKVGVSGNDGIEILEGLKEGEEVVIAEIDLKAMRDRQAKMDQVQQGGGLGSMNRGGPSQSRASSGGSGGGGGARGGSGR